MNTTPEHTDKPDAEVYGFRISSATVQVWLGYRVYGNRVELFAATQVAGTPPVNWRNFTTTRQQALREAEILCDDAEAYLVVGLNQTLKPVEDLDFDDFLNHLELSLKNAMH